MIVANERATLSRSGSSSRARTEKSNKEPTAPWTALQAGGADRNRTDDFRLAKAALSQLSYSPEVATSGGTR